MIRFRSLTSADLSFADSLRTSAGWNQTLRDWERFVELEPDGCFLATWNGEPAGTAITLLHAPILAWIGMVLVHPARRKRGIGRALLARCLEHLHQRGVRCIKLDATPSGKRVYDTLGFKDEWTLTRWEHAGTLSVQPAEHAGFRDWREADSAQIDALDRTAFGVSRLRLIQALVPQSEKAFVVETTPGSLAGFGCLRQGARALYLGPVVANQAEAGLAIVAELLGQARGRLVYWDIPELECRSFELGTTAWIQSAATSYPDASRREYGSGKSRPAIRVGRPGDRVKR